MQVERRAWYEKRGDIFSKTPYEGFLTRIDGLWVLIAILSHGIRVLLKKDDSEYLWDKTRNKSVEIPMEVIADAITMFRADQAFQKHRAKLEALL